MVLEVAPCSYAVRRRLRRQQQSLLRHRGPRAHGTVGAAPMTFLGLFLCEKVVAVCFVLKNRMISQIFAKFSFEILKKKEERKKKKKRAHKTSNKKVLHPSIMAASGQPSTLAIGHCRFCPCDFLHGPGISCRCESGAGTNALGQVYAQGNHVIYLDLKKKQKKKNSEVRVDAFMNNAAHRNRMEVANRTPATRSAQPLLSPTEEYLYANAPNAGMAKIRCDCVGKALFAFSQLKCGTRQHARIRQIMLPSVSQWGEMHAARHAQRVQLQATYEARADARRERRGLALAARDGRRPYLLRTSPGTRTRANKRHFHCDCKLSHTHSGKCFKAKLSSGAEEDEE